MGWLRDRLARLGMRGPSGRDAVAAAVLAVLGLARIPVTLLLNGGRLPVPAWQLSVSPSAVKTHVGSLLAKLGCRDRVQAVVYAYEHGVVTPGEDASGPGADGEEEGRR
jgi:hypothetical protein